MKQSPLIITFILLSQLINAQARSISKEEPDSLPYTVLDSMPEYAGGYNAINTYINNKIDYPARERMHIWGTAYIVFIVEKNGSLSNLEIKKGINTNVDRDLIRIVQTMTGWKPGIKYGKPVRARMFLYFKFSH